MALSAWLLVAMMLACAGPGHPPVLRMSDAADEGDAARRASQRLVLRGIEEDTRADGFGLPHYERALQVDPTNPWAYLALARHELAAGSPERALSFLDQAEVLAAGDQRAAAHLLGLRGAALRDLGRGAEAAPLLERARALAPQVWSDAQLDASELW